MVETLFRRKVDLCCVQETRFRGGHCRIIKGKDSRYKLFWSGNNKGTAGVEVFVAEKWIEKVFEVKRVSDRIILVKIKVGQRVLCFLSVYAQQCGLSDSVKDLFYDQLMAVTAMIPASEFLIPCGDWNGHVGSTGSGNKEVHGGYGYGKPDPDSEGERILEYALVDGAITAKHQAFKAWKAGKCTQASYSTAKRISRRVVHHARHEADKVVYDGIDHKSSDIFRLANQMRKENIDVVGDKPVKNDAGEMPMSKGAKQNAWAEHYERLLNVEFDWDPDHQVLSNEPRLEGLPIPITIDMVKKAISKMKSGKAAGPSGIVVEMIKAAGDTGATMIRNLATAIIRDGQVPTDWEQSFIVCLYKGKGDALDRGNYRGLKLT